MEYSSFSNYRTGDYQRDNFDKFLKKIHFSFNIPGIHIAGTNGKGSTAKYLAAGYIESGYKVGLFTSPSLTDVNHMILINDEPINDNDINEIIEEYKKEIAKFDLSAFEVQTLVAFEYFKKQKCDIVVIECGMGGLLDATNIFTPVLSIITTISLEHTDYLGYSLSEVAEHKAGIIKENVPVLIQDLPEDALNVVLKVAKDNKSNVCYLPRYVDSTLTNDGYEFTYSMFGQAKIKSCAKYSLTDACFALEAIKLLKDQLPVDTSKVVLGLSKVVMPCRLEIFKGKSELVLDGGHNPEAAKTLVESLSPIYAGKKRVHVVFACFRDKNLIGLLQEIGAMTNDLSLTTFPHPRARTYEDYFLFAEDYKFYENPVDLINQKIEEFPNDVIIVTGSLAFTAYIRHFIEKGEIKI